MPRHIFYNRESAGKALARQLLGSYSREDVVVYALPRGGVVVGAEVARAFGAPFDIVVTQRISHPMYPEFSVCAIAEGDVRVYGESGFCGMDHGWVDHELGAGLREVRRRTIVYRHQREVVSAEGKVAIIVDDGISNGLMMKAAIEVLRRHRPARIVVATPIAPHAAIQELFLLADDVVVLVGTSLTPLQVHTCYAVFPRVSDNDVLALLDSSNMSHGMPVYPDYHKTCALYEERKGVHPQPRSTKHSDIQKEPPRVAHRLEGVVKNTGIKPRKKAKKSKQVLQSE